MEMSPQVVLQTLELFSCPLSGVVKQPLCRHKKAPDKETRPKGELLSAAGKRRLLAPQGWTGAGRYSQHLYTRMLSNWRKEILTNKLRAESRVTLGPKIEMQE